MNRLIACLLFFLTNLMTLCAQDIEQLERDAQNGDPKSERLLGMYNLYGWGGEEDYAKGVYWLEKASAQSDAEAMAHLGNCYEEGFGVPKDGKKALELYQKSAEAGCGTGAFALGSSYYAGKIIDPDVEKAKFWLEKSLVNENLYAPAACYYLACIYESQNNPEKAKMYLRQGAAQDDGACYFKLAEMLHGEAKEVTPEVAFCYQKAASLGESDAAYELAHLYFLGNCVQQDDAAGMYWLTQAAENGVDGATSELAYRYENGKGCEKDLEKATYWRKQDNENENPKTVGFVQVVEEMPKFPGGTTRLVEYLGTHIQYPKVAMQNKIEGRVIVDFIVERDGSISEEEIRQSLSPECDAEVLRIVRCMPKWEPGKQRGEPVRVRYTLPVTFRLPKEPQQ